MEEYQKRVVEEKRELEERQRKLFAFIDGPTFRGLSEKHQRLLREQNEVMVRYAEILAERIKLFEGEVCQS